MKSIRARAGATVANLAVGFDILGLALEAPFDEVVAHQRGTLGVKLKAIYDLAGNPVQHLPLMGNTAAVAVEALLAKLGKQSAGVELELYKGMPVGSGLGSSAASAAAAVTAVHALFGNPLPLDALVTAVQASEAMASGSPHADNAAPAILGGIVLVGGYDPLKLVSLRIPKNLAVTLAHPHLELRTEDARRALKRQITLQQHIDQSGKLASFLLGLEREDFDLIGSALEDVVIEPQRAVMIPGFYEVQRAAREAGALGCSISGSGPSLFALSRGRDAAHHIGQAMQGAFASLGIGSDIFADLVNTRGARIIES